MGKLQVALLPLELHLLYGGTYDTFKVRPIVQIWPYRIWLFSTIAEVLHNATTFLKTWYWLLRFITFCGKVYRTSSASSISARVNAFCFFAELCLSGVFKLVGKQQNACQSQRQALLIKCQLKRTLTLWRSCSQTPFKTKYQLSNLPYYK